MVTNPVDENDNNDYHRNDEGYPEWEPPSTWK